MKLVSPFLKHALYPGLAKTGFLRRNAGEGPAVITYHGILPRDYTVVDHMLDGSLVSADDFRRQLRLLKERYHIITPQEFRLWNSSRRELPPRSVLLTCDDGLQNILTDMLPVLQEMSVPCLFFVTGESLAGEVGPLWYEELDLMFAKAPEAFTLDLRGVLFARPTGKEERRSVWAELLRKLSHFDVPRRQVLLEQIRTQLHLPEDWKERLLAGPGCRSRFLTLDLKGLRQLLAAGMEIGAHTISHPMLSCLPDDFAVKEIAECRKLLGSALERDVWAFAYPFGDPASVTRREVQLAEDAGYECAFLSVDGGFGALNPRFALPRVHVSAEMGLSEFEAHLSGLHRSLRSRLLGEIQFAATL